MAFHMEFEGKTEQDALEKASKHFNLPKEQIKYDVLSHGSTGIFGLVGVKKAKIRVTIQGKDILPESVTQAIAQMDAPAPRSEEKTEAPRTSKKPEFRTPAIKEDVLAPLPEAAPSQSSERGAQDRGTQRSRSSRERQNRKKRQEPEKPKPSDSAQESSEPKEAVPARPKKERRPKPARARKPKAAQAEGSDSSSPAHIAPPPVVKTYTLEEAEQRDPELAKLAGKALEGAAAIANSVMEAPELKAVVLEDREILIEISGADTATLIGRKGQTLEALQYLVERIVNNGSDTDKVRVRVDAGGYIARKEEALRRLAVRMGEKVKRTGKAVSMNPMCAHDRRIVHLTLQHDPDVRTQSKGTGELRKLVIMPAREKAGDSAS
jgi:spoIIIJ-associated protein